MIAADLQTTGASRSANDGRVGRTQQAAFFDVDGTLCALPTLERRLLLEFWRHRLIPARNLFAWVSEARRLLPDGVERACRANKRYLRGISAEVARAAIEAVQRKILYFSEAMERMRWHAERDHEIVLVTGTLRELAAPVVDRLKQELAMAGYTGEICVCATQLEETDGRWSGRVVGTAMRGREKAAAMTSLADVRGWKLSDCWAYGDSASDRWMLDVVGHAVAVNPGRRLARIARERGWLEMRWNTAMAGMEKSSDGSVRGSVEVDRGAGQAA